MSPRIVIAAVSVAVMGAVSPSLAQSPETSAAALAAEIRNRVRSGRRQQGGQPGFGEDVHGRKSRDRPEQRKGDAHAAQRQAVELPGSQ